jgi:AraC family transcriptional regulator of adaptative response / DNA-3-methyladenine glycosylase II
MEIDPRICSQARRTRDARFDGRFFIGVRSTRIYCRSICPVRCAKEENVRYFPTAAAAAEAGYRPCLRCRPESSPGTPAWSGTSTTVARALRLIGEGTLENEGVERLATRLGIGSRQLRRLFIRHLGASPVAVMKTRRLHFAKKLIDETNLPFGQIAIAAGFGSVRRFNSEFRKTYRRTPTQIRKFARVKPLDSRDQYIFELHFRPPFDWKGLLGFLTPRAIPDVESVETDCYRRTIALNGSSGILRASLSDSALAVRLEIDFPEPRWLFEITNRARRMFDLAADPREIASHLSFDPLLSTRVKAIPGLRVPGCWDGFEIAVRAILGQQVSVTAASTLAGRLVRKFGTQMSETPPLTHLFPSAKDLADADIARIGLPKARAEAIRALAQSIVDGRISFAAQADVDKLQSRLKEIPGIGEWTAQYIAMRLGEPDSFPSGDLGIRHALSINNEREITERAESWRPWRAYAVMYLWQTQSASRKRSTLATQVSSPSIAA